MYTFRRHHTLLLLLLLLFSANGCTGDKLLIPEDPIEEEEEVPGEEEEPEEGESLFARYVAIGSSTTAGVMDGGINRETQLQAYPALVARSLGTEYNAALIEMPGCPPPLVDAFTGERSGDVDCTKLVEPVPSVLHNVAVPGLRLGNLFPAPGEEAPENPMATLMLGGRSVLEAVAEAKPTFVTVWLNQWELLEVFANGGRDFGPVAASIIRDTKLLIDSLETMGVRGGVVILNSYVRAFPLWSMGIEYAKAKERGVFPSNYEVVNCDVIHGDDGSVPFTYAFGELMARARNGEPVVLDCMNDAQVISRLGSESMLNNPHIFEDLAEAVQKRGWAYMDFYGKWFDMPDFPNSPESGEPAFGPYYGLDPVHLSPLGHRAIADYVIGVINSTYGTNFPLVDELP